MDNHDGQDGQELAAERTDLAEDRTILANERTFAGWMRTGLACVGIGVGFNVLFDEMSPTWVPKAVATAFILIGVFVFWAAERRSCKVLARLDAHHVAQFGSINLRAIATVLSAGATVVAVGLWVLS
jgi:putative membrane protein